MLDIDELVTYVLNKDSLMARQWVLDSKRSNFDWSSCPRPKDEKNMTIGAALVELFCDRNGSVYPTWTCTVPYCEDEVWLVTIMSQKHKARVVTDTPFPLKIRNIFAPSNFLNVV